MASIRLSLLQYSSHVWPIIIYYLEFQNPWKDINKRRELQHQLCCTKRWWLGDLNTTVTVSQIHFSPILDLKSTFHSSILVASRFFLPYWLFGLQWKSCTRIVHAVKRSCLGPATTTCVLGATNAQEKKVLMGKYITGSGKVGFRIRP